MLYLRRFRVSSSKTTPSESPKKSSGSVAGSPAGVNLNASAISVLSRWSPRFSRPQLFPSRLPLCRSASEICRSTLSVLTALLCSRTKQTQTQTQTQPYTRAKHALRLTVSIAHVEARFCRQRFGTHLFLERLLQRMVQKTSD